MADRIYLIGTDESLTALDEQFYESEDLLQSLLERFPEVLAGHQEVGAKPTRWLLIEREVGVPGEVKGSDRPSMQPVVQLLAQGQIAYVRPFLVYPYGSIEINFQYLRGRAPFDAPEKRVALVKRLQEAGFDVGESDIDRRPTIPLAELADPQKMAGFKKTMEWVISELKRSSEVGGETPAAQ